MPTTDGVSGSPSALGIKRGPSSVSHAATELVVPRSIPMIESMKQRRGRTSRPCDYASPPRDGPANLGSQLNKSFANAHGFAGPYPTNTPPVNDGSKAKKLRSMIGVGLAT